MSRIGLCVVGLLGFSQLTCLHHDDGEPIDPDGVGSTRQEIAVNVTANQIGRVTSTGNGHYRTFHAYDVLGRPTETQHVMDTRFYVYQASYGYPDASFTGPGLGTVVRSETFPDGERVEYTYDRGGAQQAVMTRAPAADTAVALVEGVKRNADGAVTEIRFGNGVVTTNTYDQPGELLGHSQTVTSVGGSPVQDFSYQYDCEGRITRLTNAVDTTLSADFGYDSLGQITAMTTNGVTESYSYDAVGNLTCIRGAAAGCGNQSYGGAQPSLDTRTTRGPHALAASTAPGLPASGLTYLYDRNGNLAETRDTGTGAVVGTVTWDAKNMATQVAGAWGSTESWFVAEARWKKKEGSTFTYYLPAARVENGALRKFFGSYAERSPDGELRFYHPDHLGTSTLVTNAAAPVTVEHQASYWPYGDDRAVAVASFDPKYKFNFKEKDESGFYDYGARLYDPRTGRWLSADTETSDGLNRYAYVRNNPVNKTDPTGHSSHCPNPPCIEAVRDVTTVHIDVPLPPPRFGPPPVLRAARRMPRWERELAEQDFQRALRKEQLQNKIAEVKAVARKISNVGIIFGPGVRTMRAGGPGGPERRDRPNGGRNGQRAEPGERLRARGGRSCPRPRQNDGAECSE